MSRLRPRSPARAHARSASPAAHLAIALTAMGSSLLPLSACSSEQFGARLDVRPAPQRVSSEAEATLRLPQDRPLSIALPRTQEQAGLDGQANADASASGDGSAEAVATVRGSGTASGQFQLGHALSNASDRQVDFAFDVRFHYAFEVGLEPEQPHPDASVGLRLYARDPRGRVLRDITIINHTTQAGPTRGESDDVHSFTLTLGPGDDVDVFLAGRAHAEVPADRDATARVSVRDLRLEIRTRPAPPVRTAGHD